MAIGNSSASSDFGSSWITSFAYYLFGFWHAVSTTSFDLLLFLGSWIGVFSILLGLLVRLVSWNDGSTISNWFLPMEQRFFTNGISWDWWKMDGTFWIEVAVSLHEECNDFE